MGGNRKADFETQGLSANYPGGRFDPLGYAKRSDLETLKVKEVMNGRLAMLATLGCYRRRPVAQPRDHEQVRCALHLKFLMKVTRVVFVWEILVIHKVMCCYTNN